MSGSDGGDSEQPAGDTPDTMVSIPGQNQTEQSAKRREAATFAGKQRGGTTPPRTGRIGVAPAHGKKDGRSDSPEGELDDQDENDDDYKLSPHNRYILSRKLGFSEAAQVYLSRRDDLPIEHPIELTSPIECQSSNHKDDNGNPTIFDNDADQDEAVKAAPISVKVSALRSSRQPRMGKFPNTNNWKRVRNTLKAASEMQGVKKHKHVLDREDSFLKKFSTRNHQDSQNVNSSNDVDFPDSGESSVNHKGRLVIQHDGTFMFYWLGVMTLAVLYNIWTCIARQAFREIQEGCTACWYSFDALFDFLYICDILVQFRTGYLDQGLMVYDSRKLCQRYVRSKDIYIDFICLLPLDLIQFGIGVHPMIRFPRFLKVYRTFRFLYMLESRTNYPNLFRVANLTHIVLLGSHWFAAFYYMISEAEDFKGEWSYPKPIGDFALISRKYLQSLYWATLTLTTIGDLPIPTNQKQYIFVIASYLIGVFVFATIVGQVGNVINNRNASRIEFERLLDGAKVYMQTHNVPHNLQKRVQRWYDYVWSRGRLNGCDINSLGLLPDKLKTELAIHVNLETLKKVTIFHECQPEFLHDLVLKMKAYIFTPGDLICRKGEVAREMFIIADGVVEIISETGIVIKRMGAGDFFGEIGILNLDGGINRRSADVRSVGYLELFVLSREDVLEALKDHPEAESVIRDYGQRRLLVVEAHRQKVKPFKTEGIQEESTNHTDSALSAQNKFLQTLKSWNSAVRKQSAQITTSQVTSPTGNAADTKRFVTRRTFPTSRAQSNPSNASAIKQGGLSIVSAEKPDFSAGFLNNRFSESSSVKRKRFGYLRTAYAQLKNVFSRKKGRRWSMGVTDSPRRKFTEQRLLLKPADDQAVTVDLSTRSCTFKPGYHVTVNIEDNGNNQVRDHTENSDKESRNNIRKTSRDKTVTSFSETDGGPVNLSPGLFERKNSTSGPSFGRGTNWKLSDPVSYIPVSTEDLDETYLPQNSENRQRAADRRSQIILDVGKIGEMWKGENTERVNAVPEAYIPYQHPPAYRTCSSPTSNGKIATETPDPNTLQENGDSVENSLRGSPKHMGARRRSRGGHEGKSTNERLFSQTLLERRYSSVSGKYTHPSDSSPKNPFVSSSEAKAERSSSLSNPPKDYFISAKSRTKKYDAENSALMAASSERFSSSQSTLRDSNSFSPSSEADDNHQNPTSSKQSSSLRYVLAKRGSVARTDTPSTSASKTYTGPDSQSLKSSDASDGDLSELGSGAGRTHPVQELTERVLQADRARTFRNSLYEQEEVCVLDELSENGPTRRVSRLKQEDISTVKRQESSNSGRSLPMSIIQQMTTDMPYQQLASEMNVLQGMIDRRLTLLEEAFLTTTAQLERMASSQDVLVQLLLRQMDGRQPGTDEQGAQDEKEIIYRL